MLLASWRRGTKKQYDVYIKKWTKFCAERQANQFHPFVEEVLDFLTELYVKGFTYSAINTALSSIVLSVDDGSTVGQNPLVSRLLNPAGRYIGNQAQIKDEKFYLFNVYGPNNDNQAAQFYDHLLAVLKKEDLAYEDKIIIGGDFNCPMNLMLDKQGGIILTRKKIEEILLTFNLHDIWRVKNPKEKVLNGVKNLHLPSADQNIGSFQIHFRT